MVCLTVLVILCDHLVSLKLQFNKAVLIVIMLSGMTALPACFAVSHFDVDPPHLE